MHVGHLHQLLGIVLLAFRVSGHEVLRLNHVGDWVLSLDVNRLPAGSLPRSLTKQNA